MKKNRIKQPVPIGNGIHVSDLPKEELDSYLYKSRNVVLDFGTKSAFYSCNVRLFNNYLHDVTQFADKFRDIMNNVHKISEHSMEELFSGRYRHCHKTNKAETVRTAIKDIYSKLGLTEENFEQELGGEDLYQIGIEGEIRLFGTRHGNVFRVYLVDYFHDIEYDERFNTRNTKHCNFCALTGKVFSNDEEYGGEIKYSDLD